MSDESDNGAVTGTDGEAITLTPETLAFAAIFADVTAEELALVLEILRSVQLEGAEAKILAGQFQIRVRSALEAQPDAAP